MSDKQESRTRATVRYFFDPRRWLDYERVEGQGKSIFDSIENLFKSKQNKTSAQFDEVVAELGLSEADIEKQQRNFLRLTFIMLLVALGIFCYALYHLYYSQYTAMMLSSVVLLISLVMAFRYHFWYFQLAKRKLGCSLKQWWYEAILGVKE